MNSRSDTPLHPSVLTRHTASHLPRRTAPTERLSRRSNMLAPEPQFHCFEATTGARFYRETVLPPHIPTCPSMFKHHPTATDRTTSFASTSPSEDQRQAVNPSILRPPRALRDNHCNNMGMQKFA